MEHCDCGKVEFRRPFCACVPCHEPKPFSSMDRSACVLHGPRAAQLRAAFEHAQALALCDTCQEPYRDHEHDPEDPILTVACDGTRVKL